jgi:hypothetical protein
LGFSEDEIKQLDVKLANQGDLQAGLNLRFPDLSEAQKTKVKGFLDLIASAPEDEFDSWCSGCCYGVRNSMGSML